MNSSSLRVLISSVGVAEGVAAEMGTVDEVSAGVAPLSGAT
jgi:hypothetical protein